MGPKNRMNQQRQNTQQNSKHWENHPTYLILS